MTSRVILELSWPLVVILPELALLLPFQGSQGKQQLCCVLVLKLKLRELFLLLSFIGLIVAAPRESSSCAVCWF